MQSRNVAAHNCMATAASEGAADLFSPPRRMWEMDWSRRTLGWSGRESVGRARLAGRLALGTWGAASSLLQPSPKRVKKRNASKPPRRANPPHHHEGSREGGHRRPSPSTPHPLSQKGAHASGLKAHYLQAESGQDQSNQAPGI
eukprot:6190754-Pleurochrysis_carterae.AAC.2